MAVGGAGDGAARPKRSLGAYRYLAGGEDDAGASGHVAYGRSLGDRCGGAPRRQLHIRRVALIVGGVYESGAYGAVVISTQVRGSAEEPDAAAVALGLAPYRGDRLMFSGRRALADSRQAQGHQGSNGEGAEASAYP